MSKEEIIARLQVVEEQLWIFDMADYLTPAERRQENSLFNEMLRLRSKLHLMQEGA